MYNSLDFALKNGVEVHHFQFVDTINSYCLEKLMSLKHQYGEKFRLYISDKISSRHLPYVVCIADIETSSAKLLLLFTKEIKSDVDYNDMGTGFLFKNSQKICKNFKSIFEVYFSNENLKSRIELREFQKKYLGEWDKKIRSYAVR